jgi:hypothetical protein
VFSAPLTIGQQIGTSANATVYGDLNLTGSITNAHAAETLTMNSISGNNTTFLLESGGTLGLKLATNGTGGFIYGPSGGTLGSISIDNSNNITLTGPINAGGSTLVISGGAVTASQGLSALSLQATGGSISGTSYGVFKANSAYSSPGSGTGLEFRYRTDSTYNFGEIIAINRSTSALQPIQINGSSLGVNSNLNFGSAGQTLSLKGGSNAASGTITLVAGTGTITSTAVTSSDAVFTGLKTAGGTETFPPLCTVSTGTIVFTANPLDTGTYNWVVVHANQ